MEKITFPTEDINLAAFLLCRGALFVSMNPKERGRAVFILTVNPEDLSEYLNGKPQVEVKMFLTFWNFLRDKISELRSKTQ